MGFKFPELSKPETLEKRYMGKMSSKAIDLLKGMLTMEPDQRMTALECLAHPYFDDMRNEEVNGMVQQIKGIHHQQTTERETSKSRISIKSTEMLTQSTNIGKQLSKSNVPAKQAVVANSKIGQKVKFL